MIEGGCFCRLVALLESSLAFGCVFVWMVLTVAIIKLILLRCVVCFALGLLLANRRVSQFGFLPARRHVSAVIGDSRILAGPPDAAAGSGPERGGTLHASLRFHALRCQRNGCVSTQTCVVRFFVIARMHRVRSNNNNIDNQQRPTPQHHCCSVCGAVWVGVACTNVVRCLFISKHPPLHPLFPVASCLLYTSPSPRDRG